ncbi:MAG TPA: site-specific integrase [Candidatus Hydrogenedentes bacterium]|nr:site-specific integrase [Candidatus Hydrogenedentota bacterium]HPG69996.1 site-specific integrase [Candidatus Hydrogenedentota bacterium]
MAVHGARASAGDITWADLEIRWLAWAETRLRPKTIESRQRALRMFQASCKATALSRVKDSDVDKYVKQRLKPGSDGKATTNRTVNESIGALKAVVARAIKQRWYSGDNPFARWQALPERRQEAPWLDTPELRDKVLECAKMHGRNAHLIFALGIFAGLRKMEVVNARWEWIDWKAGLIRIQGSETFHLKDKDNRTVPLSEALRAVLEGYRAEEGYIVAPEAVQGEYEYRWDMRRTFNAVCRMAGVPWCHPHTLRHTFASMYAVAGVSLYKVAEWLGHSTVHVTERYAHLQAHDDDINRTR